MKIQKSPEREREVCSRARRTQLDFVIFRRNMTCKIHINPRRDVEKLSCFLTSQSRRGDAKFAGPLNPRPGDSAGGSATYTGCDSPRMQSAAALHRDVTRGWRWRWRCAIRRRRRRRWWLLFMSVGIVVVVVMIMRVAQGTSQSPGQMAMWRRLLAETSTGRRTGQRSIRRHTHTHSLSLGVILFSPGTRAGTGLVPMVERTERLSVRTGAR